MTTATPVQSPPETHRHGVAASAFSPIKSGCCRGGSSGSWVSNCGWTATAPQHSSLGSSHSGLACKRKAPYLLSGPPQPPPHLVMCHHQLCHGRRLLPNQVRMMPRRLIRIPGQPLSMGQPLLRSASLKGDLPKRTHQSVKLSTDLDKPSTSIW